MRRFPLLLVLAFALSLASFVRADTFDSGGVEIHYVDRGKGEAIVFVHGYCGDVSMFDQVVTPLLDRYRVIAIDCRGHGNSGKPHDHEAYGAHMVADIKRLLDHLRIDKAHIAGYSMGGMLTLRFVTDHPERVLSAVPCGFGWPERESANLLYDALADSLEKNGDFAPLFETLTPEGAPAMPEAQVRQFNAYMAATGDIKALAAVARGFKRLHLDEAKLRANDVPVRVIVGKDDPLAIDVRRMKGVLESGDLHEIEGDHMTAFANPEMLRLLFEFIESHRATDVPEPKAPVAVPPAA